MAGRVGLFVRNNVVGFIALFVALGTGAYAASALEKNEVKSKHIKDGQVQDADLADSAVTSPKVANGSLLGEDFAAGQLPAGARGPQGVQGEQGLQGERGLQGPSGATNVVARLSALTTASPDSAGTAIASCNPGERATGGGFDNSNQSTFEDFRVIESDVGVVNGVPTAWRAAVYNADTNGDNAGDITFYARVVCAAP